MRTGTHSVTYTSVTVPETSDFTSAENFGASEPTTSMPSSRLLGVTGVTETATGGLPVSATGIVAPCAVPAVDSGRGPCDEQATATTVAASRMSADFRAVRIIAVLLPALVAHA